MDVGEATDDGALITAERDLSEAGRAVPSRFES